MLEEALSPHLHLQACVPEFEYPRQDLPSEVRFVGALRPEPATVPKLPPWWAEFLADDRPAVLVRQGTLRPDLTELVLPTIAALVGAGLQVVVTTGAGSMADLRAGLRHGVPDWLRVARWIPYEDVLPHVDAFVTNGGYTGVTLALAHGVPLVQVGSSEEKAEIGADRGGEGRRTAVLASARVAAAARDPAGPGRPHHPGRRHLIPVPDPLTHSSDHSRGRCTTCVRGRRSASAELYLALLSNIVEPCPRTRRSCSWPVSCAPRCSGSPGTCGRRAPTPRS